VPKPKFQVLSAAQQKALAKKDRMAYRKSLIAAGRAKAATMPNGPEKQKLLAACERFERDNHAVEMARLSQSVYQDHGAPEGWTRLSEDPSKLPPVLQDPKLWSDPDSNFHAALYQSQIDGSYVLAYRGTDPGSLKDWGTNIAQNFEGQAGAYTSAMRLGRAVQSAYGPQVQTTGHSLGGGEAAASSVANGLQGSTFNAAGVNPDTVVPYGGNISNGANLIQNYHVSGDPLTAVESLPPIAVPNEATGEVYITPLVQPAIGQQHTLPAPPPHQIPMQTIDDLGGPIFNSQYNMPIPAGPFERHGIQTVINSFESEKGQDQSVIGNNVAKG